MIVNYSSLQLLKALSPPLLLPPLQLAPFQREVTVGERSALSEDEIQLLLLFVSLRLFPSPLLFESLVCSSLFLIFLRAHFFVCVVNPTEWDNAA